MQKWSLHLILLIVVWSGMMSLLPAQDAVYHWGDNEPLYTCGVSGNHLYLGGHYNGLYIARMGSYGSVDSLLLAEEYPDMYRLIISDTLLIGVDSQSYLKLLSVSDPENPILIGETFITATIKQIVRRNNVLALVSAHDIFLYDITYPAYPTLAYAIHYNTDHAWNDAAFGMGILFCTGNDGRLTLYDVSDIYHPQIISQQDHTTADFEYLYLNSVYVLCVRPDGRISIYDLEDTAVQDFLFLQGSPNQAATVCAKPLFTASRFLFVPTENDTIYIHDMIREHLPNDVHRMKMDYHISSLTAFGPFLVVTHLPGGFSIYRLPAFTDDEDETATPVNPLKAYPNPFSQETTISFSAEKGAVITINIYNTKGQKVFNRTQGCRNAMTQTLLWDGKDTRGKLCSNGIYFIQASSREKEYTSKVLYIK